MNTFNQSLLLQDHGNLERSRNIGNPPLSGQVRALARAVRRNFMLPETTCPWPEYEMS